MVDLKVEQLCFQPYSCRRGGATYYFQSTGSLDAAVLRGRWESAKAGRNYIHSAGEIAARINIALVDNSNIDFYRRVWFLYAAGPKSSP